MVVIKKDVGKRKYEIEHFDSVVELARTNKKREVQSNWKGCSLKDKRFDADWTGIESIEKAYEYLEKGWQEGTDKINSEVNKFLKTIPKVKNVIENQVYGFIPNVPLSLLNVPNSMINMKRVQWKSKVISIVYDNGASYDVSSDEIINAGKNLISVILQLEMNGYRVELKVINSFCSDGYYDICLVDIKKANQTLNLKKMMFPFAHSAWLRVLGFDWQDKCVFNRFMSARGRPYYAEMENEELAKSDMKEVLGENTVYINYKMAKRGIDYLKSLFTENKKNIA